MAAGLCVLTVNLVRARQGARHRGDVATWCCHSVDVTSHPASHASHASLSSLNPVRARNSGAHSCRLNARPATAAAMLLRVLALAMLAASALACGGKTVISQNFNQHGGGYKPLSLSALMSDFPRGNKRPGAGGGKMHSAGFTYAKGLERAEVGNGHLRVKQPQGVARPVS